MHCSVHICGEAPKKAGGYVMLLGLMNEPGRAWLSFSGRDGLGIALEDHGGHPCLWGRAELQNICGAGTWHVKSCGLFPESQRCILLFSVIYFVSHWNSPD